MARLGPNPWRAQNDLVVHFNPATAGVSATVAKDLPGDFPHGATLDQRATERTLTLSMHAADTPLVVLNVPSTDASEVWEVRATLTPSQNEALSSVDVNADGVVDLITGTQWLDGRSGQMQRIGTSDALPDRHVVVAPENGAPLRLIVGDEAPSSAGHVTLYTRLQTGWDAQHIATLIGPMSLDAGDIDLDGDIDVVVGEHHLAQPARARLVWLEQRHDGWRAHRIGLGDEHHDGAQLADFDGDGDLDIVSIGWTHSRVIVYENPLRTP